MTYYESFFFTISFRVYFPFRSQRLCLLSGEHGSSCMRTHGLAWLACILSSCITQGLPYSSRLSRIPDHPCPMDITAPCAPLNHLSFACVHGQFFPLWYPTLFPSSKLSYSLVFFVLMLTWYIEDSQYGVVFVLWFCGLEEKEKTGPRLTFLRIWLSTRQGVFVLYWELLGTIWEADLGVEGT